jgi:hypothetical protein
LFLATEIHTTIGRRVPAQRNDDEMAEIFQNNNSMPRPIQTHFKVIWTRLKGTLDWIWRLSPSSSKDILGEKGTTKKRKIR